MTLIGHLADWSELECGAKSTGPQANPYILYAFFLTLLRGRVTIRHLAASGCPAIPQIARVATGGEATCNICRAGRCSASIRLAPHEATGCARTFQGRMPAWNFVLRAAAHCKRCPHRSVRACACGRVRWLRAHRCGRARAKRNSRDARKKISRGRGSPAL